MLLWVEWCLILHYSRLVGLVVYLYLVLLLFVLYLLLYYIWYIIIYFLFLLFFFSSNIFCFWGRYFYDNSLSKTISLFLWDNNKIYIYLLHSVNLNCEIPLSMKLKGWSWKCRTPRTKRIENDRIILDLDSMVFQIKHV